MTTEARLLAYVRGYGSAVTIGSIAAWLRVPRREVEQAVTNLRLAGHPLTTDSSGVRYATTSKEVAECASRLRSRAINQLITSRAMRATSKRMAVDEAKPLVFFGEDVAA